MKLLKHLVPDEIVGPLAEVDLQRLRALGKQGLLLDLDNTLAPWRARSLSQEVQRWVEQAKALGFEVLLLSNAQNPDRVAALAEQLKVAYLARAKKPLRRAYERASALLGLPFEALVIIGDQLLTDIWGGRRLGIYSILIRPVNRRTEFIGTKFDRMLERLLLRYELRKGLITAEQWRRLWPSSPGKGDEE